MYFRVGIAHKAALIVCLVSALSGAGVDRVWADGLQPAAAAAALHDPPRQSDQVASAANPSMPEAASLTLFALSLIGLAVVARRRRQQR
jgi:hypothetical protein